MRVLISRRTQVALVCSSSSAEHRARRRRRDEQTRFPIPTTLRPAVVLLVAPTAVCDLSQVAHARLRLIATFLFQRARPATTEQRNSFDKINIRTH